MRPVHHRTEARIRAHVILRWLAHVGTFTGPAGIFRQRTELGPGAAQDLTELGVPNRGRVLGATPATS